MSFIGYARVSTADRNPSLQIDALRAAGCTRIFTEAASGALADRPQPKAALEYIRPGESLVVWKLDLLAWSLPQLISTVELLQANGCFYFRHRPEDVVNRQDMQQRILDLMASFEVHNDGLQRGSLLLHQRSPIAADIASRYGSAITGAILSQVSENNFLLLAINGMAS